MIGSMFLRWSTEDGIREVPCNIGQRLIVRKMYRKWRTNKSRGGSGYGKLAGDGYAQTRERSRSEALYDVEQFRY
jgi:hypothetical protein